MKAIYALGERIYKSEVVYFEKDGVMKYDKNGSVVTLDHYQVNHGNAGVIDLFDEDIIDVYMT